jgi:hypothetical protein
LGADGAGDRIAAVSRPPFQVLPTDLLLEELLSGFASEGSEPLNSLQVGFLPFFFLLLAD